jgi:hypothetical protein
MWPYDRSKPIDFIPMDTEKLYKQNLKRQPEDWIYRSKPVKYHVNDQGYRAPKWEDIDWSNCVVVAGCSNVFGIGLDQADTVSEQLSRLIGLPVINFGRPGSSMYANWWDQLTMLEQNLKPKCVVNIWTEYTRITRWGGNLDDLGPWNNSALYREWNMYRTNPQQWARMTRTSLDLVYKAQGIQHVEASFYKDTVALFDIKWFKTIDYARDCNHPGVNSVAGMAKWLAERITV